TAILFFARPEHRADIDVEDHLLARGARERGGAPRRRATRLARQAGAGNEDRTGASDEFFLDVARRQMNVGALRSIEDERKAVGRLDPEKDEPGLVLGVETNAADVDAFLLEKPAHE